MNTETKVYSLLKQFANNEPEATKSQTLEGIAIFIAQIALDDSTKKFNTAVLDKDLKYIKAKALEFDAYIREKQTNN